MTEQIDLAGQNFIHSTQDTFFLGIHTPHNSRTPDFHKPSPKIRILIIKKLTSRLKISFGLKKIENTV